MNRRDVLKSAALSALAASAPLAIPRWSMALAQDGSRIFTLAHPPGFPDLDPATSFSNDGAVLANVYEGLTRYIPGKDDAPATIAPVLATGWETSADGLTWTFKLREGVKFHDGSTFDAVDAKASIERILDTKTGAAGKRFKDTKYLGRQ